MRNYLPLLVIVTLPFHLIFSADDGEELEFVDPNIIDMAPFVVYGGIIDTVDGFTGKEYHEDDPVVLGFREQFNDILLGFHRKLLIDEHKYMTKTLQAQEAFEKEINIIGKTLGMRQVYVEDNAYYRERVITDRLLRDPFFIIDALVVWDADRLERYKDSRPDSIYAKDIRYNHEIEKWERRITTKWDVFFVKNNGNSFSTNKEQGLNLDTNKGYHLIEIGLPDDIVPRAFQKVNLTYPIFVNSFEPADVQIQRLQKTFISNLFQIYDPYSWIARRSTRFSVRGKYKSEFERLLKKARLPVTDRNWFDTVLSNLVMDMLTIKHIGLQEVYRYEMVMKIPIRDNILGEGFDPLNWNEGENRSLNYDHTENKPVWVNFKNAGGARWVMVDAYRRYGEKVLGLILQEITTLKEQKKKMTGKDLVKKVLAQLSGTKADNYIKAAEKVQKQELEKFRIKLK